MILCERASAGWPSSFPSPPRSAEPAVPVCDDHQPTLVTA
jgi:hypothetical protein